MKKDKEWAQREVDRYLSYEGVIEARDALVFAKGVINRLDEPEVLSKEWIDRHITDGHNVNLGDKVVYADELDGMLVPKQELPVIPQFVADWWGRDGDSVTMYGGESIDKKRKIHLISNFNDRGLGDHLSKVEDWIDENESSFLDLVNSKVYEVEKEPLYYAQIKGYKIANPSDTYWHVVNNLYVVLAGRNEIKNSKNKLTLEEWADFGITSENAEFTEVA